MGNYGKWRVLDLRLTLFPPTRMALITYTSDSISQLRASKRASKRATRAGPTRAGGLSATKNGGVKKYSRARHGQEELELEGFMIGPPTGLWDRHE
ncbi:hypothetical protein VFPBJ_05738 [Purpureocillium lilacinum]|uniref:Uncharacterized protein n=1 Tax=Purpureocillium lilacinum TaxID=33203 RepID=A0A179GS54_PURLI|nr:hypothetical protein VFPBJ_05738 [Purpureocillium lilacinum]